MAQVCSAACVLMPVMLLCIFPAVFSWCLQLLAVLTVAFRSQYSTDDLRGMRVAHEADQFDEGESKILTLKDAYVLKDGLGKEVRTNRVLVCQIRSKLKLAMLRCYVIFAALFSVCRFDW